MSGVGKKEEHRDRLGISGLKPRPASLAFLQEQRLAGRGGFFLSSQVICKLEADSGKPKDGQVFTELECTGTDPRLSGCCSW